MPGKTLGATTVAGNAAMDSATLEGPVDRLHLRRQTLGDAGLEREILALFRRQSASVFAKLAEAREHKERRDLAHTLKGSARAIGAWRVAAAAEAVESAGFSADLAPLEGAIAEADAAIIRILAA
jgi:HPt (histidine-containing phosphotransfer) domain-containing protein